MSTQVRILLLGAVAALALGWAGLRRGNEAAGASPRSGAGRRGACAVRRLLEPAAWLALLLVLGGLTVAEGRRRVELERRLPLEPRELYRLLARGSGTWQVLDVRQDVADGYDDAHVPGALPLPGCDLARAPAAAQGAYPPDRADHPDQRRGGGGRAAGLPGPLRGGAQPGRRHAGLERGEAARGLGRVHPAVGQGRRRLSLGGPHGVRAKEPAEGARRARRRGGAARPRGGGTGRGAPGPGRPQGRRHGGRLPGRVRRHLRRRRAARLRLPLRQLPGELRLGGLDRRHGQGDAREPVGELPGHLAPRAGRQPARLQQGRPALAGHVRRRPAALPDAARRRPRRGQVEAHHLGRGHHRGGHPPLRDDAPEGPGRELRPHGLRHALGGPGRLGEAPRHAPRRGAPLHRQLRGRHVPGGGRGLRRGEPRLHLRLHLRRRRGALLGLQPQHLPHPGRPLPLGVQVPRRRRSSWSPRSSTPPRSTPISGCR